MRQTIAARSFDHELHSRFAELSGDVNPMHVDADAARRTPAGAPVIHGIHALLWSLDRLAELGRIRSPGVLLEVEFLKFLYVGDAAELVILRDTGSLMRCAIVARGLVTTRIDLTTGGSESDAVPAQVRASAKTMPRVPRECSIDDIEGAAACIALPANGGAAEFFPHLSLVFGSAAVNSVAMLSALVGMECPGLHSIFAGLRIAMNGTESSDDLCYSVTRIDRRFQLVELAVAGSGMSGTISAVMRPRPVEQTSLQEIADRLASTEFSGTTAAVIGGSRGLGALTARLLVAGGARVIITYLQAEREAQQLAAELGQERCRVLQYDARNEPSSQLAGLSWRVNQLYYFATPRIFQTAAARFSPSRFHEMLEIYVDGFYRICVALRTHCADELSAFYPSSIAVVERPRDMTEYAMAKSAAEVLCRDLDRFVPALRVIVARLPRLLTDQTASVLPGDYGDSFAEMLHCVRQMHDVRSTSDDGRAFSEDT